MQIEQIDVGDLIPYINNSRTHSDEQVMQVASSMKEFGFTNPILIDGEGGIIAGHGRLMAAKKLGLNEVPCIRLGHLSEAQRKAYVIADNQLALNSGWDFEYLKGEIDGLSQLDFNIDILGFDDSHLANIYNIESELKEQQNNDSEPVVDYAENEMILKFKDENQLERWYKNALSEGIECKIL